MGGQEGEEGKVGNKGLRGAERSVGLRRREREKCRGEIGQKEMWAREEGTREE
jgi:hypothetical protein